MNSLRKISIIYKELNNSICGIDVKVACDPSKVDVRVRFSHPAPFLERSFMLKLKNGEQFVVGIRGPKGERVEIIEPGLVYTPNDVFMDSSIDVFYDALTKTRKRYAKIPTR